MTDRLRSPGLGYTDCTIFGYALPGYGSLGYGYNYGTIPNPQPVTLNSLRTPQAPSYLIKCFVAAPSPLQGACRNLYAIPLPVNRLILQFSF